MSNVVLIGMPGSGKSTLGVILAKAIGYSFIDSDLIIQKQQGRKLYRIIQEDGIDAFIDCEKKAIMSITAQNTVIATGGSAVLNKDAMRYLKSLGTIVYLCYSPEEIEKRINNIKTRGIVMRPGESIFDVYNERAVLYEKYSDITARLDNTDTERALETVIELLKLHGTDI